MQTLKVIKESDLKNLAIAIYEYITLILNKIKIILLLLEYI